MRAPYACAPRRVAAGPRLALAEQVRRRVRLARGAGHARHNVDVPRCAPRRRAQAAGGARATTHFACAHAAELEVGAGAEREATARNGNERAPCERSAAGCELRDGG